MKKLARPNKPATKFFFPRIVLKFNDDIDALQTEQKIGTGFQKKLLGWSALSRKYPGITIEKLFTSVEQDKIVEKATRAKQITPHYQPPNFLNYYSIRCPHSINA